MTQIANYINSYSDNTAYSADQSKDYPNVSYIVATDEVKWNKYDPDHIVCIYNVTSTESATTLLYKNANIAYQIIDGVQQQSVQTTYTFDTLGEHIVKYKLSGTICDGVFFSCSSLTSITLPNTLESIDNGAFRNCSSLTNVTIPNSITNIGDYVFYNCSSLTNITIPSGVTNIGDSAFCNVGSTTNKCTFTILATTPPTLATSYNVFTIRRTEAIYVPAESVNAYKAATNWSTYASRIQAIPTT